MKSYIERFLEYPVESTSEWHGGLVQLSELIGSAFEDLPLAQSEIAEASMALWTALDTKMVHSKPEIDVEPFEQLVRTMLEFINEQSVSYRPARIGLTSPEWVNPLKELLEGSGTCVEYEPDATFWNEVKNDMCDHMASRFEGSGSAPSLAESNCSNEQISAFAEAAAAYYRGGIWQHLSDLDLLKITTPKPPRIFKYVTILGFGRQEYGLCFCESPETHWGLRSHRTDIEALELFSLTYIPVNEASETDIALWEELQLPLETGDAFPLFLHFSAEGVELPEPKELEFVTIVLHALANTSEAELDSGQWTKQISIESKNKRCRITIPDLLDPPDRKQWLDRGVTPEPRGSERHFRLVQNVMAQNEGMNIDQLNELLNSEFTGSIDDFDYPSETPFDRAENLCFAAIDSYGRRRIQIARQALEEDPTHVEANNLLAESTFDLETKIDRFENAVEFARQQNEELLETEVGNFWEISETRPFLRAMYGLALALESDGQRNEAIGKMLDILELNSNDNLGVRYEIVPLLLSQNREAEASDLLDSFPEETACWLFLKAQVEFRRLGPDGKAAQSALSKALRFNPHVLKLLENDEPPMMPEHYVSQSPEEAEIVILEQLDSWLETDGFVECMFATRSRLEREDSKRNRDHKRKRRVKAKKTKKSRK